MCPLPEILLNLFIRANAFLGCHINHAITEASEAFRDIMKYPVAEETKICKFNHLRTCHYQEKS
jgi:hypothetical protein